MLAFDFGTRKIGVAVGNTVVRVAHPLTTVEGEANAVCLKAIDALVAEWAPGELVVGRPLDGDGSEHEMTARAERFARQLEARFGLPVARVDERFTTRAAVRSCLLFAAPACRTDDRRHSQRTNGEYPVCFARKSCGCHGGTHGLIRTWET